MIGVPFCSLCSPVAMGECKKLRPVASCLISEKSRHVSWCGISHQSTIYVTNRAMPVKVHHINMQSINLEYFLDSYNSINTGTVTLQVAHKQNKKS